MFKSWNWEAFYWMTGAIAFMGMIAAVVALLVIHTGHKLPTEVQILKQAKTTCSTPGVASVEWELYKDSYGEPQEQLKEVICK